MQVAPAGIARLAIIHPAELIHALFFNSALKVANSLHVVHVLKLAQKVFLRYNCIINSSQTARNMTFE